MLAVRSAPARVQVIDTVEGWRKALAAAREKGRTVGLVPTMGALHAGHAALIERAAAETDVVGVTIFVNPLQFGPTEDLAAYPRPRDNDLALAEAHGATLVFAPTANEMYPRGRPATTVSVQTLTTRWEGESRPGHFDGVATVVTKLLSQAGPCRAYFGEKDYQQLCVVRRLVADLDLPAEIVGCPTVREPDGLAMSSRNAYLTPEERAVAPNLHRALQAGAVAFAAGAVAFAAGAAAAGGDALDGDALDGDAAAAAAAAARDAEAAMRSAATGLDVIYAAAVDPDTLEPTTAIPARLLIAARLGRTRLIDNLGVNP